MMKKALALLFSFTIVASMAIPAFASNETSAYTELSYSYEREPDYVINIPTSFNINYTEYISITSSKMDIDANKRVKVKFDEERTGISPNGISLVGPEGSSLRCDVWVSSLADPNTQVRADKASYAVAFFDNYSTSPYQYGRICFVPDILPDTVSGTYTKTVYFEIILEEKP